MPASTMNTVTVLEDDNYASKEVPPIRKEKRKTTVPESLMSSAQRRKLADISNLQDHGEETHQQQNMLFSSKEYTEKLQKENMTLMKALAHRNKIIELSGVEFQKLRINLRNVQEKNLQLAQTHSHMLAELNTNRDRLKALQHELGCKNVLLIARKMQLEEQTHPCTHHASKDKVLAKISNGDCKSFQAQEMNHIDTKRKRTPRIKCSENSNVKPINVNEKANSKRRVSGVIIDSSGIPEENCQTEDDIKKGVVSQGENQIVDSVINKKFVLDAANPVKDSVHSKRQRSRRQSTKFDVEETEPKEKLLGMDDTKETKETTRPSFRRRSARLRPEEAEPCKRFHEIDEVRETIKRRRVSSRQQSARFDFQEPEVTETLNADDAGRLVNKESVGSKSEAVEPSEARPNTKETNENRRVSTRRQSTKGKPQTATETIKEITTNPSLHKNIVQECDLIPSLVSKKDHVRKSKHKKLRADETEGVTRRTSVGRPSRHAAEKVQSYKEVSLRVKMRRSC